MSRNFLYLYLTNNISFPLEANNYMCYSMAILIQFSFCFVWQEWNIFTLFDKKETCFTLFDKNETFFNLFDKNEIFFNLFDKNETFFTLFDKNETFFTLFDKNETFLLCLTRMKHFYLHACNFKPFFLWNLLLIALNTSWNWVLNKHTPEVCTSCLNSLMTRSTV